MDFSFFDNPNNPEQLEDEKAQLKIVADSIGSYLWKYKPDFSGDTQEHLGVIAQDLLKVPGLEGAVTEKDGVLRIDPAFVATAALGLVAALARVVLGGKDDQTVFESVSNEETAGDTATEGTGSEQGEVGSPDDIEQVQPVQAEPTA